MRNNRFLNAVLNAPMILQIRRNHALEHATIHILSERIAGLRMAGRSDAGGFVLIGDAHTDDVIRAVSDALSRLRRGERQLAIHPNCGTNLVTTGYLTSFVAVLATRGANRRDEDMLSRLPFLIMAMMMTILISQPLGTWLQRYVTTEGNPGDMEVLEIKRRSVNWLGRPMTIHQVSTRSNV